MKIIQKIKEKFSEKRLKKEAASYGVPFQEREWYNYRAMLPKDVLKDKTFIEIFDSHGNYIDCPGIGGTVILNSRGRRFEYKVVGFKNESRNRDWLYDTDFINPIIRYQRVVTTNNA